MVRNLPSCFPGDLQGSWATDYLFYSGWYYPGGPVGDTASVQTCDASLSSISRGFFQWTLTITTSIDNQRL